MKRKMKGKVLAYLLAAMLVFTLMPNTVSAADPSDESDHEKNIDTAINELSEQFNDETRDPFNYVGKKYSSKNKLMRTSLPDSFDLRSVDTDGDGNPDANYVTPVKLQNPFGTCWGFAAIAAAETSILGNPELNNDGNGNPIYSTSLKQGEDGKEILDLSEKHLVYFTGTAINDPDDPQNDEGTHYLGDLTVGEKLDMGGVPFFATSLFSSGMGPNITTRAYPANSGISGDMREVLDYWGVGKNDDGEDVHNVQKRRINNVWTDFCYSPDDDWSIDEKYRFLQSYKLAGSFLLPTPAGEDEEGKYQYNPDATNAIKKQVYDKRAVQMAFFADTSHPDEDNEGVFISKNWAHYTYEQYNANHAVTIVGWDDNYPRENFIDGHQPPADMFPDGQHEGASDGGNGAWLVKNSWGSGEEAFPNRGGGDWGVVNGEGKGTGYFWLSYYDQSLSMPEALEFDQSNVGKQYYIDQYDFMPVNEAMSGTTSVPVSAANVFTAEHAQRLTQVSCQTSVPGTKVTYEVYLLPNFILDPQDGVKVASEEATYEFGGFHKISLSDPVLLQKGQHYSVVVTQALPDGSSVLSLQQGISEEIASLYNIQTYQKGVINFNESFVCVDGQWFDIAGGELMEELFGEEYGIYSNDNFPIKGYSEKISETPSIKILGGDVMSLIEPNKSLTLTMRFHGASGSLQTDPKISWRVPEEYSDILSVEPEDDSGFCEKAVVTAKGYGKGFVLAEVEGIGTVAQKIFVMQHEITRASFADGTDTYLYTGKAVTPKVLAECGYKNCGLEEGKDYEVTYEDNIEPGVATAIVTGINDHQSTVELTFRITGKDISKAGIVLSDRDLVFNGSVRKPKVKTIGGAVLDEGWDYTVSYSDPSSKNVGVYKVTVKGKGDYTGQTSANYRILPKGTSLTKISKSKKAVTVKWKKQSKKMSKARITGYQIQLATDSNFKKNARKVTVKGYKKTNKKISKLRSGKKYYVRIRTYKKTGGTTLYSKWSKVKTVKVR